MIHHGMLCVYDRYHVCGAFVDYIFYKNNQSHISLLCGRGMESISNSNLEVGIDHLLFSAEKTTHNLCFFCTKHHKAQLKLHLTANITYYPTS